MKKLILSIILFVCASYSANSQESTTYFPYPAVPDRIVSLSERCNYLLTHFWDHCNFKNAFSSLPKMEGAVKDFLSFMPYATADTAHMAIGALIKQVKKNPKHILALGRMARAHLMSDSADFNSEELYLPFAQAVASNKKVPAAERAAFEREARIIANSQIGARVADMSLERPDGSKTTLSANTAPMMLLFFTGSGCSDCSISRLRLSADYALNQMIEQQRLKIINIYVGEDNDEWKSWASSAPETWVNVRSQNAQDLYDLSVLPTITYLNRRMEVIGKDFSADDIIRSFQQHIMTH